MKNKVVNLSTQIEIKHKGLEALKKALGPADAVRFIQQYEKGTGDYTKEKYQNTDLTLKEIDILLKRQSETIN
jgi:hypothetical protein